MVSVSKAIAIQACAAEITFNPSYSWEGKNRKNLEAWKQEGQST